MTHYRKTTANRSTYNGNSRLCQPHPAPLMSMHDDGCTALGSSWGLSWAGVWSRGWSVVSRKSQPPGSDAGRLQCPSQPDPGTHPAPHHGPNLTRRDGAASLPLLRRALYDATPDTNPQSTARPPGPRAAGPSCRAELPCCVTARRPRSRP